MATMIIDLVFVGIGAVLGVIGSYLYAVRWFEGA